MNSIIKEIALEKHEELIDFCKRIIEIKSNSGEEKEIADEFVKELEKLGYEGISIDDWGNVTGLVRGTLPGPVIMYNGHMDAVDGADPDSWGKYSPYEAVIDEVMMPDTFSGEEELTEVIHGRGAGDLKCNLAACLYAGGILAELKKRGMDFPGVFLLTAVVLEENGEMMGTIKLCEEELPKRGIEPDAMVCCEPSGLKVMLGHRGRMEIRVEVKGRSCHGSSPWLGINAVEKSAKLIERVSEMMALKTEEDPYLGKPGMALTMYHCEPNELCIVPDKCVIVYDRRLVPGETVEGAIREVQDIVDELAKEDPEFIAEVSVNKNLRRAFTGKEEVIESSKPVWIIDREHPFIQACSEGLAEVGEPVIYDYWAFSTDTPQLGPIMKKPVIGYGPGQEFVIHTTEEKARIDYIKRSLLAYVAMFLKAGELPMDVFFVE